MRHHFPPKLQIGQIDIANIHIDYRSRDDIPQLLRGLQEIYKTPEVIEEVFRYLESILPEDVSIELGRPGMALWSILVLGTLRVNINADYDRVLELANEHKTLREMLGHGILDAEDQYALQTLKDNLKMMTPEVLKEINRIVVTFGHKILGKEDAPLKGRCDSVVMETDVDYPTDIRLLTDAVRRVIMLCGQAGKKYEIDGWRQYEYNYQCIKNLYQRAQKLKPSSSKDEDKKEAKKQQIIEAHEALIALCQVFLGRAEITLAELEVLPLTELLIEEIQCFMAHADRQIDQIQRRVVNGETIPHEEKVFSVFEEHTEWIQKGKAGVPVELGLRVCILEDEMGFILHHKVMERQTDDKVAVEMVTETQAQFPQLRLCSFDKGFYTKENREQLQGILDKVVLPKKGRWSKQDRLIESEEEFVAARKQHPAVESAINALEVHGLDRCLDHGLDAFKRYVALAVVGRNIQKLGSILLQREKEIEQKKQQKLKRAA
jgi:IS5 family transposase